MSIHQCLDVSLEEGMEELCVNITNTGLSICEFYFNQKENRYFFSTWLSGSLKPSFLEQIFRWNILVLTDYCQTGCINASKFDCNSYCSVQCCFAPEPWLELFFSAILQTGKMGQPTQWSTHGCFRIWMLRKNT